MIVWVLLALVWVLGGVVVMMEEDIDLPEQWVEGLVLTILWPILVAAGLFWALVVMPIIAPIRRWKG